MNSYQRIREYSGQHHVDLEDGYRVWTAENGTVRECPKADGRAFEMPNEAFDWARRHTRLKSIVVTGPNGVYIELDDADRDSELTRTP